MLSDLLGKAWQPLLGSSELLPGGPPVGVELRSEPSARLPDSLQTRNSERGTVPVRLVAFRDSAGRVGVLREACPHVGTSRATLARGETESDGLRCRFHGWKFDVNGVCIDIPDVPKTADFGRYPRAQALEVREQDGMVWVRF